MNGEAYLIGHMNHWGIRKDGNVRSAELDWKVCDTLEDFEVKV